MTGRGDQGHGMRPIGAYGPTVMVRLPALAEDEGDGDADAPEELRQGPPGGRPGRPGLTPTEGYGRKCAFNEGVNDNPSNIHAGRYTQITTGFFFASIHTNSHLHIWAFQFHSILNHTFASLLILSTIFQLKAVLNSQIFGPMKYGRA